MTLMLQTIATLFLLAHLVTVALFLHRLRRPRQQGLFGQPFVTLLRPVCGLDPFDEETLRSSFTQDYPRYEIIFCAQSSNDPVIPLVRRLMRDYPDQPARLLIGYDAITGNPKLNNVLKGWQSSRSDWVCMTDSNLLLPADYLATVVGSWGPATGLVSCPPVGIRPQGWAAHLECAFLNSNQARLQFAADSIGPAYAQGKTLYFNKPLLEQAGGLRALGQFLAEDVAATKIVRDLGLQVTLTPLPFAQPIGQRSLPQVWGRQLRWSRVRRDGFPPIFAAEVLNGGLAPTLICLAAGMPAPGVMAFLGLWYLAEYALMRRAGWPAGWRDAAALPIRDLMMPLIWLATFAQRGIEWRGTVMAAPTQTQHPAE